MAPGINGRQTGTVPKTKAHNDASRDIAHIQREQSFNNIPNNLVTLDWQPSSDMGHSRARKTSNTQSALLDCYDLGPEGGSVHDNGRFASPHYSHGEEQQMAWGVINRCSQEVNGRTEGSPSTSSGSRQSRAPRNVVLPDHTSKSNNITKMPDRNQVVCRLNQICDYIKQTSSLMDTLKNSGDPRHMAQYHKLSKMVAELRESEQRLQAFLPSLEKDFECGAQENKPGTGVAECGSEVDVPSVGVNSSGSPVPPGGGRRVADGRSHSEELGGAVLKSSDSARRNELKMKVEESQRRLQVLQEHQAALLALQEKAQDQLKEARAAQGILMSRAVGVQCAGSSVPSAIPPTGDERSAGCPNGISNSQNASGSGGLQGNMQNISDRLQTLHDLYENRNQLVQMLGEGDEDLVSEQLVLHDKLQELEYKKQHMDHLVAEFQTINNLPAAASGSQADAGSSKDGSDGEAECSDGEPDYEIVRDKVAELNRMKAQLAQLKGIMSAVQNVDICNGTIQNGMDQAPGSRAEGEEHWEPEEQAVNLRRQKRDKSRGGSVRSVARSNSNTSGSSKPDNIVQAGSEVERARDIQLKTVKLQEAKARLQQLQDLMAAVTDFHSRGQPVPDQYIDLLSQEVAREEEQGAAGRAESSPSAVARLQRHSVERERTPVKPQVLDSGLPEGCEVTLEVVQAMTRDLRQQTLSLQEERERLVSAQRELGKLTRELPLREKKTNTQVDSQTHQQLLLQAELQAKRRELEELMRKDQGQTSAINQDVCSEVSADKSDAPAYSFLAEGTTNATWGGSTHGTLDDLAAEQDNDIQEHSAGYSSDEGQDGDEEEIRALHAGSSQQLRQAQLNNSCNNNNKDPLSQTTTTTRELLSMSLESGHLSLSGNINTDSNTASVAGSNSRVPLPAAGGCSHAQRQGPASHNVWRKASTDSGMSVPRAVWTPSSQQVRQGNLSAMEELVTSSNNLDTNNSSSSATLHNTGLGGSNTSPGWWQHQALQLQHQLEVTSNLCQSMLLEQAQQQQQQQQHGNNLLAAVGSGNNLQPYWGFPPPPYPTTPHPQAHAVTAGGFGGHLLPTNVASDVYYQQLLAATQLQQQQMLLTTVNQCCQLLWLQQREMVALRSAVQTLQEKSSCGNGSHGTEGYSSPVAIGQSEEATLITSNRNSARPTPHQSQSNLMRLQQPTAGPTVTSFSPHQNLKPSYSGGLFQSPEEMTASSGVTSAHSLPNLSQTMTSANSVFSPHHADTVPSNAPLNNSAVPNFSLTLAPSSPAAGSLTLSFPVNNNANFNNRSQQQPLSSLIQCCASEPGSCAPWLQQGATGGTPGLLQGQTNPSPVPALNNQVAPGNRANNYWDNFRSYSRQNLLSASTKSNEGVSHSPSPLVDRSHNTLRGVTTLDPQPSTMALPQGIGAVFSSPEQNMSRKEKLNTEQYQSSQDGIGLPEPTHSNVADTVGLQYQLVGAPSACSCCPRSREPPHSSSIQPQQNISRPKTRRQVLVNENIPQDLRLQANVSGISSLVGCASGERGGPSFSSAPALHLDSNTAVDVRNVALAGHDAQRHQNVASSSEPLSSYRCNQECRDELSEFSLINADVASAPVVIKKKNPKVSLSSASETQQKCAASCDSIANIVDPKPRHVGNALFEAFSESVYSEVAALISSNENRPHFLVQLFRDLQMISSDPLRQRTLQSIQEIISQYLANTLVDSHHQSLTDNQQLGENENFPVQDENVLNEIGVSCDEEQTVKDERGRYHLAESLPSPLTPGNEAHCLPNLVARRAPGSIAESEEGAAALLPSAHSSPRALPKNAAWNVKDGLSLPTELPGRSSKLDWEVQAVLMELLPFLNTHLNETCCSSLLEAVRRLTLQLVRAQNLSLIASTTQHSSQPSRLGCCYQGQLDALLEDALLKFQGCRLRDISEELLTVVAEVLLSELTFLRLVDTVSRGDSNNESNQECCRTPTGRDLGPEECTESGVTVHQPAQATQHFFTSEIGNNGYHDSRDAGLGTKAYNADLAEADQSHHEESADSVPDLETESAAAMSVAEEVSSEGQSTQAEGVAAANSCIVNNTADATENDTQADDLVAVSDETGDFIKTEVEEWEVEQDRQDREQGLDRVPTRLSTDQPRAVVCSSNSIPERDGHGLVPQPDAPSP